MWEGRWYRRTGVHSTSSKLDISSLQKCGLVGSSSDFNMSMFFKDVIQYRRQFLSRDIFSMSVLQHEYCDRDGECCILPLFALSYQSCRIVSQLSFPNSYILILMKNCGNYLWEEETFSRDFMKTQGDSISGDNLTNLFCRHLHIFGDSTNLICTIYTPSA